MGPGQPVRLLSPTKHASKTGSGACSRIERLRYFHSGDSWQKAKPPRGISETKDGRCNDEVAARHPDIGTDRLYIDAGSMMFITNPERYEVVVTENVFSDITSERAAGVVGGLGVAPSGDVSLKHGIFHAESR